MHRWRILYLIAGILVSSISYSGETGDLIKKHGLDTIALRVLESLQKILPREVDKVTIHTESYYDRTTKEFGFVYVLKDTAITIVSKMMYEKSPKKYSDYKEKSGQIRKHFGKMVVDYVADYNVPINIKYFCSNFAYSELLAHGMNVKFTYRYNDHSSIIYITQRDCIK